MGSGYLAEDKFDQPEFDDLILPGKLYAKALPAVGHPVDLMGNWREKPRARKNKSPGRVAYIDIRKRSGALV